MIFIVGIMTASIVALIGLGVWLELAPVEARTRMTQARPWLFGHLALFVLALLGLLFLGLREALAEPVVQAATRGEVSVGLGLAIIGAGLPTAVAALAAAMALGPVGSAALAVIAEKPELFGRTLIYLGLAEGIAIYGLVMSILLLGKI
jgi:V/A-type H+-transporting ATPase subunit K